MTTTDKGWQCVPVEPTRAQIEKLATLWGYTVEEAMGVYSLILDVVGVAASKPEPDGDDGAKILCEWLGFEWDGINDGSVVARGYRVFTHGQFGWKFQGRKDDLRDIASKIAVAPKPEPSTDILSEIGRIIGPMGPDDPEASQILADNITDMYEDDPKHELPDYTEPASTYKADERVIAKPEPSADLVKRAEAFLISHAVVGQPIAVTYQTLAAFAQEIAGEVIARAEASEKALWDAEISLDPEHETKWYAHYKDLLDAIRARATATTPPAPADRPRTEATLLRQQALPRRP